MINISILLSIFFCISVSLQMLTIQKKTRTLKTRKYHLSCNTTFIQNLINMFLLCKHLRNSADDFFLLALSFYFVLIRKTMGDLLNLWRMFSSYESNRFNFMACCFIFDRIIIISIKIIV